MNIIKKKYYQIGRWIKLKREKPLVKLNGTFGGHSDILLDFQTGQGVATDRYTGEKVEAPVHSICTERELAGYFVESGILFL